MRCVPLLFDPVHSLGCGLLLQLKGRVNFFAYLQKDSDELTCIIINNVLQSYQFQSYVIILNLMLLFWNFILSKRECGCYWFVHQNQNIWEWANANCRHFHHAASTTTLRPYDWLVAAELGSKDRLNSLKQVEQGFTCEPVRVTGYETPAIMYP